jgi:hypothetical protein
MNIGIAGQNLVRALHNESEENLTSATGSDTVTESYRDGQTHGQTWPPHQTVYTYTVKHANKRKDKKDNVVAMKAYGGVDVQIHVFLTSALAEGEWSASRQVASTPGKKATGTHWIGGWVDPRAGPDDVERRKFLTLPGLELRTLGRPARNQSLYRVRYPDSVILGVQTPFLECSVQLITPI